MNGLRAGAICGRGRDNTVDCSSIVASITNALNGSLVEYSYNSLNSCSLINALNNG